MKTNDLIAMLAREPAALARPAPHARVAAALIGATAVSLGIMLFWLGANPTMVDDLEDEPMFLGKILFGVALAIALFFAARRVATPGANARTPLMAAQLVVGAAVAFGLFVFFQNAPEQRVDLMLGTSWRACPVNIAILSLPVFIAAFWAMRQYAPTRLTLAGFVAGAFAGAVGLAVYSLYCTEYDPSFVAVWYVAGACVPAIIGAAIGRFALRW